MPEYLAPGVYVEEVPSGTKPIVASGTSTAGMIGMCARGPVNVPTLVTSQGGFARTFGGLLHPLVFTEGRDALPYAAEGFFVNGGSRLFVVRIVGAAATESVLDLEALDSEVTARPELAMAAVTGGGDVTTLVLGAAAGLTDDMRLLIEDGEASEVVTLTDDAFVAQLRLTQGLRRTFATAATVTLQTRTPFAGTVNAEAAAGAEELTLTATAGLSGGDWILLGEDDLAQLVEVATVDADGLTLALARPLRNPVAVGDPVATLADSTTASALTEDVAAGGAAALLPMTTTGIDAGDVVLIADGTAEEYAIVRDLAQTVTLSRPLVNSHPAGVRLVPTRAVLRVHARYPGVWGDSLRVTLRPANLVSTVIARPAGAGEASVRVGSAFGLFPGSVVTIDGRINREVAVVNAVAGDVTFTAAHDEGLVAGMTVVSQEFTLTVERIENGKAVESETFERLAMAPGHPRYALTLVGSWDAASATPSASGGSNLIRLGDLADAAARRLPLITGLARRLDGGDDDVGGVSDATYMGTPSDDPGQRTGIFAMQNESAVSIVAVPGQTSVSVQQALVAHCEQMRYRFAVLDTPIGADLQAARAHRQNFDSTRCAVYYPSLERADSFGAPGDRRVIAPSGHVLGIYARTDTARGVHKAPANEVVRGVLAFDTKLDKGAQDILNPINLNCCRDFRSENRGLRIYGARVATSDPEFKYINVRRLLLMIEQSLDIGLQWAVFEPNDKPLWDTVKQSVTGFLTTVWRSGALEGQKAEEAFFVNIGYNVTMTQDDIDNGRMIVEIGVAPVKPAEFVIVKISQKTREAEG
ncbi:phage tail sheath protein [Paracoccus gahaiensis]|uniref:Phage tail sheath protein n=1 Tax=Paracoccus gahaiensis TaxID=1706839 RepID=A0A4U0RA65_9RHOB|nr:phage tail sheath C-terminal domain-containing protein [Paracoccus gahaiensis]TJZ91292.1 phage tail sheath protein [Paracoccus gahaiensis]